MKNLNSSSGSEFHVELKNGKNSDVKYLFHADIHYSNDDKIIKQVKLTNNIMHTRTLETVFLSLSIEHTHTEQQTTTRARTPKALKTRRAQRARSGGLGFSMHRAVYC